MALLEIKHLKTYFYLDGEAFPAVDDISFSLNEGKTLAIIGESGSGKSVTALSIMGLVDYPGKIVGGEIRFQEKDLIKMKERELRDVRGNDIAMIYQDPMSSLNPMIKVGKQIEEAIKLHQKMDKLALRNAALDLMTSVGITDCEARYHQLPDQFSGGMRQRIIIAMAIACQPKLLIADEPTTALDVTIQAEILDLLRDLKKEHHMAMILNTHDLGVVAEIADDVVVMYCGKIMEISSNQALFDTPLNPYTQELMTCIPRIDDRKRRLETIKGYVPHLSELSKGCRFSDRCKKAFGKCSEELPELKEIEKGHWSRCWLHDKIEKEK
jgi:oligopeptide/dipeptide ABC transporter, ATP-binding protein, C-terminal domain